MAELLLITTTSSSIEVCITGLDVNYSNPARVVTWFLNELSYAETTIPNGYYQSPSYTFNYLTPGTTYRVMALLRYYNWDGSLAGTNEYYSEYTTDSSGGGGIITQRPPYFYWTYPKIQGNEFVLTAAEWNELTSNINAVRSYLGYYEWGFTYVYPGYQVLADYYNQCVWAIRYISDMNAGTIVEPGYYITANLLNQLQYLINSIG